MAYDARRGKNRGLLDIARKIFDAYSLRTKLIGLINCSEKDISMPTLCLPIFFLMPTLLT